MNVEFPWEEGLRNALPFPSSCDLFEFIDRVADEHGREHAAVLEDPTVMAALLTARRPDISAVLASSERVPAERLRSLALHPDQQVRAAVAANPAAPTDVLERLASDSRLMVRNAVTKNPRSPDHVRVALVLSDDQNFSFVGWARSGC